MPIQGARQYPQPGAVMIAIMDNRRVARVKAMRPHVGYPRAIAAIGLHGDSCIGKIECR